MHELWKQESLLDQCKNKAGLAAAARPANDGGWWTESITPWNHGMLSHDLWLVLAASFLSQSILVLQATRFIAMATLACLRSMAEKSSSTAKIWHTWPSYSWITSRYTQMWRSSCSMFFVKLTKEAHTLLGELPEILDKAGSFIESLTKQAVWGRYYALRRYASVCISLSDVLHLQRCSLVLVQIVSVYWVV